MPSRYVLDFKITQERLRTERAAGASGSAVADALTDALDTLVRGVWDGPKEAAVVAVGGYGRSEMSFGSDIDLIVIHPKPGPAFVPAKQLSYEMYDTGMELGFAVHTPKESIKLARSRFDVEASFRDARLIFGDQKLFDKWSADVRLDGFETRLAAAVGSWRAAGGDAGSDLEPNIKEGRGGLRDLCALRWLGVAPPLGALELMLDLRTAMHLATQRRSDTMLMQLQAEIARLVPVTPPDGYPPLATAEEELLRAVYLAARSVAHLLDARLGLSVPIDSPAGSDLEDLLSRLRALDSDPDGFWRYADGPLLEKLPEWKNIHCLPQRNVYHRYAVDVHSVEVVKQCLALASDPDPLTAKVAADSADAFETLLLAALFHDIGKGNAEDHSARGARIASEALSRLGVDQRTGDDVVWLVANHLLLSETATRRDIGDESTVIELAERAADEKRLRLLFLLSVADGLATGPSAWSKWKATLVSRLFSRAAHVIEEGTLVGSDISRAAHETQEAIRIALAGPPEHLVAEHLAGMPRAWLISAPVESLVAQSRLMLDPPVGDEVFLTAEPQSEAGIWEVTIVAGDRPGLFSKVAGTLALHGLSVLGAQIFTREDGIALEVFRVEAVGDEQRRFERVSDDAIKALKGRLSLDLRLADKRRDYAGKVPKGKQEPPQVVVDNKVSDFYTVIEVHATDRVGLLYTITKALSDLSCDIHLAKVSTYAEDVVDVFYVRDLEGQKITDPDHSREIERTILHRLATDL